MEAESENVENIGDYPSRPGGKRPAGRVVLDFTVKVHGSEAQVRVFETENLAAAADAPKSERFAWWLAKPNSLKGSPTRLTFAKSGDGWRLFEEGALVFPAPGRDGSFTFSGGREF